MATDEQVQRGIWESRCPALLAERDRLREALVAMAYVHPCNCGDGIPEGTCARCRAVRVLGFDPATHSRPERDA